MTSALPSWRAISAEAMVPVLMGAAIILFGIVELAEGAVRTPETHPALVAATPIAAAVSAIAGVVAAVRRPANRMGFLLLGGGFALLLSGLDLFSAPLLVAIGALGGALVLPVVIHALHAFPTGSLRGACSPITVTCAWITGTVLQVPVFIFGASSPLATSPDPVAFAVATTVQQLAWVGVIVATAVLLFNRLRLASAVRRRVLAPLYVYGVAALGLALLVGVIPDADPVYVEVVQLILIAGVPIEFLVALARGGFESTGRLEALSYRVAASDDARRDLGSALRAVLGDPSAEIVYWSDAAGGYVDASGAALVDDPRLALAGAEVDGRRVGAVRYDTRIVGEHELAMSAAGVLGFAIERERLAADLRASRDGLRASRRRLVGAAEDERRRIAADLHDGLQSRLVMIALAASEAERTGDAAALRGLRSGVDQAIADLRAFVHAVMPAALTERGVSSAIRELVDEIAMPVELELELGPGRLAPEVESAAYMVVAEGISNVIKHAAASRIRISAEDRGDGIRVCVDDDGLGGAALVVGSGLGRLRDRVEAVGGRLEVEPRTGGGTRLVADLPRDAGDELG
ncbi:histidine kinase [Homoserinibacter sp. GY 40078]|uniref:histidine kinase n=1 Tax=Homoserinibacter sp. GY 40078 TaxID=2603275 RepID=UPI0011C8A0EB|nr:histidine kinase [Homoserinibacter sp. GY 40078]TXK18554.1 hypothetical protein FVQ89_00945 [Homoserinibacter sp. GY 40078]